jgi:hypothetical protein
MPVGSEQIPYGFAGFVGEAPIDEFERGAQATDPNEYGRSVGGLLDGLLPNPPYLVGYCRWDGRSDQMALSDNHTCDLHVAPIHKTLTRGISHESSSLVTE